MIIDLRIPLTDGAAASARYETRNDEDPMHSVVYPDRVEIYAGDPEGRRLGQRPILTVWMRFWQQLELRDGLNAAMRRTADHNKSERLHRLVDGEGD